MENIAAMMITKKEISKKIIGTYYAFIVFLIFNLEMALSPMIQNINNIQFR
jgi:hypothetical protein